MCLSFKMYRIKKAQLGLVAINSGAAVTVEECGVPQGGELWLLPVSCGEELPGRCFGSEKASPGYF